jgi:hypothetical protein
MEDCIVDGVLLCKEIKLTKRKALKDKELKEDKFYTMKDDNGNIFESKTDERGITIETIKDINNNIISVLERRKSGLVIDKTPVIKDIYIPEETSSNLLKDKYPGVFALLHPTKNKENKINVDTLTCGSNKKVWWLCPKNPCGCHEYLDIPLTIITRRGCPFCNFTRERACIHTSFMNDPKLSLEYAWDLNGDIDPHTLAKGSSLKVWWRCSNHTSCDNHIWKVIINKRAVYNHECPYCSNRKSFRCKCNSFMNNSQLASEFDQNLNPDIDPWMISTGSDTIITWKCSSHSSCGEHIWSTSVYLRKKSGCPFCSNFGGQVCRCKSFMNNPILARQFSWNLNVGIDPWKLYNGHTKIWWICDHCNESWQSVVSSRLISPDMTMCPTCILNHTESLGEKNCKNYLENKNIKISREFRIKEWLSNRRYDFEFFHKNRKFILEYNGEQHYKCRPMFHENELEFYTKQEIDKIKLIVALIEGYNIIITQERTQEAIEKVMNYFLSFEFEESKSYVFLDNMEINSYLIQKLNKEIVMSLYPEYVDLLEEKLIDVNYEIISYK